MDKSITSVDELTFLKFIENDAPFYSKLELYHDDDLISDCSFKPEERNQIKKSLNNCNALLAALNKLNKKVDNIHLSHFIELIESYKPTQSNQP